MESGPVLLMVPVMMYCFEKFMGVQPNISPLLAFGTNMAIVVPTALSGALRHKKELKKKNMSFPTRHYLSFAVPVGLGGFTGSVLAFVFFTSFRAQAGIVLKTIFGVFCLVGAYRFMRSKPIPTKSIPKLSLPKFSVSGYFSGILAHFIGIGGRNSLHAGVEHHSECSCTYRCINVTCNHGSWLFGGFSIFYDLRIH